MEADLVTEKANNSSKEYTCHNCNYVTTKKCDFDKHLQTRKHSNNTLTSPENIEIIQLKSYTCATCSKQFNDRSGLWRHQKKCTSTITLNQLVNVEDANDAKQLIHSLIKDNAEFKQLMIEQNNYFKELMQKGQHNTTNITSNTVNNSFNLQVFLNETCKNAMNIMDFVSQLQVEISDVEETGRLGFAEGISKIFINGLKQINISDRPIHCSDFKRETLYIKNNNEWNKEGDTKTLLTNAIKHVAHKNMKQISNWTKQHPNYNNSDSKENDRYLQIVSEAMPGITHEETNKSYSKIIKNIAKETTICK